MRSCIGPLTGAHKPDPAAELLGHWRGEFQIHCRGDTVTWSGIGSNCQILEWSTRKHLVIAGNYHCVEVRSRKPLSASCLLISFQCLLLVGLTGQLGRGSLRNGGCRHPVLSRLEKGGHEWRNDRQIFRTPNSWKVVHVGHPMLPLWHADVYWQSSTIELILFTRKFMFELN